MAEYTIITTSRTTAPDMVGLVASLRSAIAPELGCAFLEAQTVRLKKNAVWTEAEKTTAQSLIDSAPAATPQSDAQRTIDDLPLWAKALALTILDEINLLRQQHALPPRTAAQLVTAMKNKAAAL